MLGKYVMEHFSRIAGFSVLGVTRNEFDAVTDDVKTLQLYQYDVVINCIGTIKSVVDSVGVVNTIKVNSLFPHTIANECKSYNTRLIHITTDCVFSGERGSYTENDLHDATDVYGKTKSLGEPETAMVIRTSIIGEEVAKRSLIEWVKSKANTTVSGYTNHTWNGVTCLELAKFIEGCIKTDNYWTGVQHVFSPQDVTKLELVHMISDAFNLSVDTIPTETQPPVYRTLRTIYTPKIQKSLREQINELPGFFA